MATKGKQQSKEHIKKRAEALRRKFKMDKNYRRKIILSIKKQHRINPNYGMNRKKHSEKTKEKISKSRIGMKPWNWKGGITLLNKRIYFSYKYRQWRSDVFTRDNFTCVLCGIKGGYLEADHYPKMFSEIITEYQIKEYNQAMECGELWNLNNGRTLCKNCHKKFGRTKCDDFWK